MSERTLAVGPVQIERWLHRAHDAGSPRWTSYYVMWYDNPVSRGLILIDSLMWLGDPSPPHWGRDSLDLTPWRAAGLTAASFCMWGFFGMHVDHVIQWLIPWPANIFGLVISFESLPNSPISHHCESIGGLHCLGIAPFNKSNPINRLEQSIELR
jgi:hypothetical protein